MYYTCKGTVRPKHVATNLFSPLRGLSWHLHTEIFPLYSSSSHQFSFYTMVLTSALVDGGQEHDNAIQISKQNRTSSQW